MSATLDFKPIAEFVKKLNKKELITRCFEWGAEKLLFEITAKDIPFDTGRYRKSWKKNKPKKETISVETPMGQLMIWLEFTGTVPHEIVPKRPGYPLHWIDPDTGEDVFRYKVWHPGTTATPHLRPAIKRFLPKWQDYIFEQIKKNGGFE